jgi:D-3-phosphoglycerate dehydrogenase
MTGEAERKKVGIRLPRHVAAQSADVRWAHELEALAPIADIIEIHADTTAEFASGARDLDAIITSWGMRIDKEIIGALQRCVVIGVGSVGVDMVDVEAATAAGIVVTNVPDVFIEEVADHAMMLLLSVARMTPLMTRMARDGEWYEARPILSRRDRLLGQTLGLYAFGNVARATARRARAFGLRVIAYDPYVSELEISGAGVEPVSFGELLERSDYLSVHAPHNAETEHAIDAAALRRMKPTAGVINTARGPIIDEAALIAALRDGVISGAGLDVTEQEPAAPDNPLLSMDNVIVTPHVASASTRMRPETRRRASREVALVLRGRWPMSCVNPTVLPRAVLERWQPYPMNRGPNR